MLSFFTLWAKVKALADEKLQAGPYLAWNFSSARL
jgi:hypothetical protein